MTWRQAVRAALKPADAAQVIDALGPRWAGARIYLSVEHVRIARLDTLSGGHPRGASERFVVELIREVRGVGGTLTDVRAIPLPLGSHHLFL